MPGRQEPETLVLDIYTTQYSLVRSSAAFQWKPDIILKTLTLGIWYTIIEYSQIPRRSTWYVCHDRSDLLYSIFSNSL